jgi:hypothetical protein
MKKNKRTVNLDVPDTAKPLWYAGRKHPAYLSTHKQVVKFEAFQYADDDSFHDYAFDETDYTIEDRMKAQLHYKYIIGPFSTEAAAKYFVKIGGFGKGMLCVSDVERAAKVDSQSYLCGR